ncbi:hypothetical protein CTAYLR_000151 [Chrysophaeum taylorii]|uniref:ABC1 atypical kinase-like domain-containing protein n=1 Tax=Chrysophaeum taylorii TaxID=2483200 RepID=A0AAD7UHB6_9STRA|nr:hypothetical protein CTAYLR_000151 [Chrysophaeum taylorii]
MLLVVVVVVPFAACFVPPAAAPPRWWWWSSCDYCCSPREYATTSHHREVLVVPPPQHAVLATSKNNNVSRAKLAAKRTSLIWSVAAKFVVKYLLLRRSRLSGDALKRARKEFASEFRDALVRLGPTFIKFGQLLSTRVDVLPPEVIQELVSLQNDVPGFSPRRALEIIREELGEVPFATFDETPLAAASLAQVHRATLETGEDVVVKVQRDGLLEQFRVDCANIRFLARVADRLDPQEEGVSANWKGIAESSEKVLFREIDFLQEKESALKFRENFHETAFVRIPRIYDEFCTRKVLTMEYVAGAKINAPPPGSDTELLASRLTTSYLDQLCRHGFFHCDPHPGNVAVDENNRIIYYDFGMMEKIEPQVKKGFVDLVYALYKNDPMLAVDALELMGVLRENLDRFSVERVARSYVSTFAETIQTNAPWENQMDPDEARAVRRARRAKLGADLFATQAERPFVFPPKFTFVFRALSTIDGIGKTLDPKYDLTRLASPYLRELADLRDGSALKTALLEILRSLGWRPVDLSQVVQQPRNVANVQTVLRRLERGDLKLRVRAQECESVLERIETRQKLLHFALVSALLFKIATQIAPSPKLIAVVVSKLAYCASAFFAAKAAANLFELEKLERRKTRFFDLSNQRDDKPY